MSPSTPSRCLNWLFYDPANANSRVKCTLIPGDPQDVDLDDFEWEVELKRWFKFRAERSTMKFWMVTHRPTFSYPNL